MLTLDAAYGFRMCFLMVSVVSQTARSLSARGALRGDAQTGLPDCGQRQSSPEKAERRCFVIPAVAIV